MPRLSLVAVTGGDIAGHIIATRALLDPAWGAHFQALALRDGAPRGPFRYAPPFEI